MTASQPMSNEIGSIAAEAQPNACFVFVSFFILSVCCSAKPQFQTQGDDDVSGFVGARGKKTLCLSTSKFSLHVGRRRKRRRRTNNRSA
jgi:hypothetical protein